MKTFCKLTTQSPAASYVPLPRFLLQDEALRDISNDAKVLYALLLDRASISRQNGYIIKVDYTEQKKLAAAVSRAATNINQICRRINSTGRCYEDDVAELKARQAEIWELLKARQKDEL